jgi:hypothetical protein
LYTNKPKQSFLDTFFNPSAIKNQNFSSREFSEFKSTCYHKSKLKFHAGIVISILPYIEIKDHKKFTLVCKQWKIAVDSQKNKLKISSKVLPSQVSKMLNRFNQVRDLEFSPHSQLINKGISMRVFNQLTNLDISRCVFDDPMKVIKFVNKCDNLRVLKVSQHVCNLSLLRTLYKNAQVGLSYFKALKLKSYFKNKVTNCVNSADFSMFLRESKFLEKLQISKVYCNLFKVLKFENIKLEKLITLDIKELYIQNLQEWKIFIRYMEMNFPLIKSFKLSKVIFLCRPPHKDEFEQDFCSIIESKTNLKTLTLGEYSTNSLILKLRRSLIHKKMTKLNNLKIKSNFVSDDSLEEFLRDIEVQNSLDITKATKICGYCIESLSFPPKEIHVGFDDYKLKCLRDTLIDMGFGNTLIYRTRMT